ncbi:hypothetical protein D3C71_2024300 [compost metagenome]
MRFANRCKHLYNFFRQLETICLTGIDHHTNTAERLYGTLQWSVGLQADNFLLVLCDITWGVRGNRGHRLDIDIQYTAVLSLLTG